MNKSIGKGPLGLFSLSTFAGDYSNKDKSENEVVSNIHLTLQLAKGIRLAGGAGFHFLNGFVPQVGFQFQHVGKHTLLVANPTLESADHTSLGSIAIFEYRPQLKEHLQLYLRLQALYIQNLSDRAHERSFLLARIGPTFDQFTTGLGVNFDYYGPLKKYKQNTGIFFRYQFM